MSGRILVAWFSAGGATARVARELAEAVGADRYEIRPAQPYTAADTGPSCEHAHLWKLDVTRK